VHCGSVARFDQGYKEIARRLKVPGTQDPETDVVKAVFDWLSDEDNGPWLLVLDNADDQRMFFEPAIRSQSDDVLQQQLGMLAQYLPRSAHGMTLITTRDRRVGERFAERDKPVIVLPLEIADATSMLRSRLPNHLDLSATEVAELLESLQYLPLAIAQAASYISEEDVTLSRYLELLRPGNADAKLLLEQDYYDPERHADIHNSVFQTWKLSFDQIQRQTPRAAEILSLMSMLDKQSIPRRLLHDGEESPVLVDKALGTLKNFSLIQEEKTHQTYGIHRLVQLSTHWWLEQQKTLTTWQERALDVVLTHCPSSADVEDWEAWESISPHITVVQQYHFEQQERKLRYANITSRIREYYQVVGRYEMALKMQEGALTIQRAMLGEEHPSTLDSMHNLASVLDDQGKYKEAEIMHREELELCQKILGKEHPSTLNSMNNLALVLDNQGKYEEAEIIHRRTLELRQTVLGKEHPSTLDSMNNLAIVLKNQGKYEEAEMVHREELELCQKILGKDHPSTLGSMDNLALVLRNQGKYEEAEIMHRRTFELRQTILGEKHPSTLNSMNNLAVVLKNQGKYEEAEILHRQTLKLKEAVLGKEHPSTLGSMDNLALVLGDQGKYEEAEIMHRRTLKLRQTILGKEHPSTLDSMYNLALVLGDQGKYEEAEIMHRRTLKLRQTILGKEHPSTLDSMYNLALVLKNQGKYEEAETMHREELELCQKIRGKEHPSTLTSINNLASILDDQGKHEEAEAVRQRRLPSNEDRPG
jgi:tetratricopeptide (TPR) repeat protein